MPGRPIISELLLGAGRSRQKRMHAGNPEWADLTTLDIVDADVIHDLNNPDLPFGDGVFDEIHAYEVLEHVGSQGDWRFFFDQWSEFWRVLKPGGLVLGTCPHPTSPWAWGDPGHTRVMAPECFTFLDRTAYAQVGATSMTDYRPFYAADFETVYLREQQGVTAFILKAHKPARADSLGSR